MNSYDLVNIIKVKNGEVGSSDRSFAIKYGFNYHNVMDWKSTKSNANNSNYLKLCRLANFSMVEAEEFANAMEKRKNYKEAGFANIQTMIGLSGMSIVLMTQTTPILAVALSSYSTLCILC